MNKFPTRLKAGQDTRRQKVSMQGASEARGSQNHGTQPVNTTDTIIASKGRPG